MQPDNALLWEIVRFVALPLLALAGSWGGTRAILNGTAKRVREIDVKLDSSVDRINRKLDTVQGDVTNIRERLARLEGQQS